MKKSLVRIIVVILSMVLMFTAVGCDGKKPPVVESFTVTVEGGTGGGSFKKDAECTLTANETAAKKFDKWTVDGKEVSKANPYKFKVTKNVMVRAEFKNAYTINVTGGKIGDKTSATVVEGEAVTVVADTLEGKIFKGWYNGETLLSELVTYQFNASASVNLTAKFENCYTITVTGGKIGDKTSATVVEGEAVTVVADTLEGKVFKGWYNGETLLSELVTYQFNASASLNLTAKFVNCYTVTVTGGKINNETSAVVEDGAEVTVIFDAIANATFEKWVVGAETVSIETTYTFTVISDVAITAVYSVQLATPQNDANQMFVKKPSGYSDMILEFDRQKNEDGSKKTAFVEGVDYILYNLYTSTDADKASPVGAFKVKQLNGSSEAVMCALDDTGDISIGSTPGDYFSDRAATNASFFGLISKAVGANYNRFTTYYVAVQTIAIADSAYKNSGISEIGTSVIQEAQPVNVTVVNGTGGGVVAKGSEVTVTAIIEIGNYFVEWQVDGKRVSTDNPYTFTANSDVTVTAIEQPIPAEKFVVTVVNGTGGGEFEAGASCTVTANDPAVNKGFLRWTVNGEEKSKLKTYTFRVDADVTITAEYGALIVLDAPKNDNNQMFNYVGFGPGRNTTEFDRQKNEDGSGKTAFAEGVDYILYHVYTSREATESVATFKLVKAPDGNGSITTMDGTLSIGCGNTPGNYYIDNCSSENFYGFFSAVIGASYSETQSYYFAAQSIAIQDSIYTNSGISEIGTSSIKQS